MSTYQTTAPNSTRHGGIDLASWALVALVVAAICASAGWAIARQDAPGRDDVARNADLAARDGLIRGQQVGYDAGATAGRREAALRTRTQVSTARRTAACEGYDAGYAAGRQRAGDPNAFPGATSASCGVPTDLGGAMLGAGSIGGPDVPGYSSSAFDAYGSGASASASSPYMGASSINGPGDSGY